MLAKERGSQRERSLELVLGFSEKVTFNGMLEAQWGKEER